MNLLFNGYTTIQGHKVTLPADKGPGILFRNVIHFM